MPYCCGLAYRRGCLLQGGGVETLRWPPSFGTQELPEKPKLRFKVIQRSAPPHNVTFPSYPPNPDVATSHGYGDLSDASGKEGRSCGGFLEDLCAPLQEGDERFGKCVVWVRGPSCSALGSVSWGRLHQAHSSCCIYTYFLGTECLTCRRTDHSAYSSSCWLQGRKTQPPAGGAFDL